MKKLFFIVVLVVCASCFFAKDYEWQQPWSYFYDTKKTIEKWENENLIMYDEFFVSKTETLIDNERTTLHEFFLYDQLTGIFFTLSKENAVLHEKKGFCIWQDNVEEVVKGTKEMNTEYETAGALNLFVFGMNSLIRKEGDKMSKLQNIGDMTSPTAVILSIYLYSENTILCTVENLIEDKTLFVYQDFTF